MNAFDNVCFAHDAAYSDSKYLAKKSVEMKRAYEIAWNTKYGESKSIRKYGLYVFW